MALSPSIPTSFVPKQPVSPGTKRYSSGNNIFLIISLIIVGVTLVGAGGVFLYSKYLTSVEQSKGAELLAAQNNANNDSVEQFVRLRDRLSASETLINQHVELSQFFTLLESITLQDVHFTNLTIAVASDNSAAIEMTGTAKDFNSLAAESTAFAGQKYIESAIFSGITVNKDGTVGFTINATLDPALVTEKAPPKSPVILAGTSTPAVAPSFSASSSTPPATTTSPVQKTVTSTTSVSSASSTTP